jgi:hypothetical protein
VETIRAIKEAPPSFPEFMSPGLCDFIMTALQKPRERRRPVAELMLHPWVVANAGVAAVTQALVLAGHMPPPAPVLGDAAAAAAELQGLLAGQPPSDGGPLGMCAPLGFLHVPQLASSSAAATAAIGAAAGGAQLLLQHAALVPEHTQRQAHGLLQAASSTRPGDDSLSAGAAAGALHTALQGFAPVITVAVAAAAAATVAAVANQAEPPVAMGPTASLSTALSGGGVRVRRNAKRAGGMHRSFSHRSLPNAFTSARGLDAVYGAASGASHHYHHHHAPALHHVQWHANGEAFGIHATGLALHPGSPDSARCSSPACDNALLVPSLTPAWVGNGNQMRLLGKVSAVGRMQRVERLLHISAGLA